MEREETHATAHRGRPGMGARSAPWRRILRAALTAKANHQAIRL